MSLDVANFGPIAEDTPVYGACRPGHLGGDVDAWSAILRDAGVTDVVCLLSRGEARRYGLPAAYAGEFRAHHLPIVDRQLPSPDDLQRAVAVVGGVVDRGDVAVVHCNAGLGRTGVVGAGWLVHSRDLSPVEALDAVENAPRRRSPREAIHDDNATLEDLHDLLARLR